MAKATRQGTSIAGQGPTQHGLPPVVKHLLSRRPSIGGASSVGGNLSPSSKKIGKTELEENPSPQEPAQTTDSHSLQTSTELDSDANSTDGDTRVTANPRSAKKSAPAKKTAAKKATVRSADGDDSGDEFDEPIDLSGEEDEFK